MHFMLFPMGFFPSFNTTLLTSSILLMMPCYPPESTLLSDCRALAIGGERSYEAAVYLPMISPVS